MTEPLLAQNQQDPIEPETFMEKARFLRRVSRDFLLGRISWQELWYYEQTYGFGRNRDKPPVEKQGEGEKK